MPPSFTQQESYLSLEGPIGTGLAIVVGLLMLGLFTWSLWKESRILTQRQVILFWVLRATALVVVLWLLLAPSSVTVETSTTRKAVAFLTDISGSMQTADAQGTDDDLRWAVSSTRLEAEPLIAAADKAQTDILLAQQRVQQAEEAIKQRQPESVLIEATTSAQSALARARNYLQSLGERLDRVPAARAQVEMLLEKLNGPELQAFDQLCNSLKKGRAPAERGWRESFSDLQFRITGIRHGLSELVRAINEMEQSEMVLRTPELITDARKSSRLQKTLSFLSQLDSTALSSLTEKADVQFSSFSNTVSRLGGLDQLNSVVSAESADDPQSLQMVPGTDLAAALESLQKQQDERPVAAAFVLSDVVHNTSEGSTPQETATQLNGIPVYVVPVGSPEHRKDVILQSVSAPKVAMRNDDIIVEVNLQTYDCADEVCTVKLLQDGEVIDFREVPLDTNFASRTIRFEKKVPIIGKQQYQVAVDPIQGEFTSENNFDEFEVNVTRNEIKLLLADELPRWEYRYLAQLFRRDDKVECDELLYHPRMIATGQRGESKTLPVTLEEWNHYDVVILGDLPPEHFPVASQESLLEYLRQRGGTLVLIAGREAMPVMYRQSVLSDVIPVGASDTNTAGPSNYAFHLTEEGRDHPALMIAESDQATQIAWDFVNQFSPVQEVTPWRVPKPSAHTLISVVRRNSRNAAEEAKMSAFLCWQPVGRGRVVYLSGPETYRLRFLRGDQFHHRFWGQLLRWAIASDLMSGSDYVRIRSDKTRYLSRETAQVSVQLIDPDGKPVSGQSLKLRVASDDYERTVPLVPSENVPGTYQAGITRLPPGVYRAEPQGDAVNALQAQSSVAEPVSTSFTVQTKLPQELTETRSDHALAQQISSLTGGQVLPSTSVEEVLELTNLDPIVTEKIERRPLWLEWKYLWIVFGCLQTEWIIRKWKGLS
jgi:hypothetical protein